MKKNNALDLSQNANKRQSGGSGRKGFDIYLLGDILGIIAVIIIFLIPFAFVLLNSLKSRSEANLLQLTLPTEIHWSNFVEVFSHQNFQIVTAFKNSALLVVLGAVLLVMIGSTMGYVIQRRKDRTQKVISVLMLFGLMVPPAIMPTIWVLQSLHMYRSLPSLILVQVALQIPFSTMLYPGFMASVPVELEEAGYIDGCSKFRIFFSIVFPLLKPVTATQIILSAVNTFNDFSNPLYFLPGRENVTVQLTMYEYMGQYANDFHLVFANVLIITLPILIVFVIFNKKIIEGMAAGAVKG